MAGLQKTHGGTTSRNANSSSFFSEGFHNCIGVYITTDISDNQYGLGVKANDIWA